MSLQAGAVVLFLLMTNAFHDHPYWLACVLFTGFLDLIPGERS